MRYLLFLLFVGCTSVVSAEFPVSSLARLNQLEKKPEVYLKGASGSFLVTNNTRVYLSLQDGREIFVYASEVFVSEDRVIIRGRDQEVMLANISQVKLVDRY